ncbi:MAG: hypothetical protein JXA01_04230 [Dehalococcoidia bacterium]|nr:hypothetical protein [Dehalococcoidia bacterium]
MKKIVFFIFILLIISAACAPAQTTNTEPAAPTPTSPATVAPTTASLAQTAPRTLTPEELAASFNLPYVAVFTVKPANTITNYPVVIKWDVQNSTDIIIEPNIGVVEPAGSIDFTTPPMTTIYKLTATNAQDSIIATTTLTISGDLPGRDSPVIKQFTANPHIIKKGESTTLLWMTVAASAVTFEGKTVPAEGNIQVSPAETTTYTLVATSSDGTQYQSLTVNVK